MFDIILNFKNNSYVSTQFLIKAISINKSNITAAKAWLLRSMVSKVNKTTLVVNIVIQNATILRYFFLIIAWAPVAHLILTEELINK